MSEEVLRSARPQGETTLAKALNAGLSDALAADDRVAVSYTHLTLPTISSV